MNHAVQPHKAHAVTVDPVCGMTVDPGKSPHRHNHGERSYHFCSAGCRTKFAADPDKYLHKHGRTARGGQHDLHLPDASANPPDRTGLLPDLRHGTGARSPAAAATIDELIAMTRRFWISLVLALPVVVLEMGGHFASVASVSAD